MTPARCRKTRGVCTVLMCLLVCLLVGAAYAEPFTDAQRAEIVRIMRDALRQDPSILRDAITALKADDGNQQTVRIAAAHDRLVDNGAIAGNPSGDVTI